MTKWLVRVLALLCMPLLSLAQDNGNKAADPSGTWRWEYELDGTQFKDLVRLRVGEVIKDTKDRELKGRYESTSGRKIQIENGRVSGDKVTFDFKVNYQGMDVKLEFDGKFNKDALTGKVKASTNDGSRDLEWSANRSVLAEDVVGKWKLKIDANGNIMEPVITISKDGDKLKASYVLGADVKIDASDVVVEKNILSFTIKTNFQGSSLKADFMGRPRGDKIDGSIDYVLGSDVGEVDFTGKLLDE